MKIFVIFTGGTIGSSVSGNIISANEKNSFLLLEMLRRNVRGDVEFVTAQPYYALSENNTGRELTAVVSCVSGALSEDCDGIIVAHGTDTLQYTAAALSCAFGADTVPIVVVSSNYVLTDERANGLANFANAVTFIEKGNGRGVFVSYKNSGDDARIHRASRIIAHRELDDAVFSLKNQYYGMVDGDTYLQNENYASREDEIKPFGKVDLGKMSDEIAVIQPYVGFKYQPVSDGIRAVIIKAYHSGTLCTDEESFKTFAQDLKARSIPCFVCAATGGAVYDSAADFDSCGLRAIPAASFIPQYVKLWYAVKSGADIVKTMTSSLGEDLL